MESKPKFTLGPWIMRSDGIIQSKARTEKKSIGIFNGIASTMEHQIEHQYNCHLIAAAPTMYEALEALTDPEGHIFHGPNKECTGECKDVRAALKTARGEM